MRERVVRKNIRIAFRRPELLAVISVAAILIAGALTKAGHAWWGIAMMAAFCVHGVVVEHSISVQRIGAALGKWLHASKSTPSMTNRASLPALKTIRV